MSLNNDEKFEEITPKPERREDLFIEGGFVDDMETCPSPEPVSFPPYYYNTAPNRSYCNMTTAMHILKMSRNKFLKMRLMPIRIAKYSGGHGGKEYFYTKEQIQELLDNPAEIERRVRAVDEAKKAKDDVVMDADELEEIFGADDFGSDDWSDV